jgi:hypothetical protein
MEYHGNMISKLAKVLSVISLLFVCLFFMRDLAKPGLPKLHDSNPHISRMIAYHTALDDGQFPPMWAREVMGGIGSPVMMLNYQLPYMISELFVRNGVTIFDSYKLVLALSFVASALLMYKALSTKLGILPAWAGALLYSLAPYRFLDIYVRGALGESLSFIFPPLLIWGFSKKSWPLLILGWSGLFLTHPTASAVFSAFFLGYALLTTNKKQLITDAQLFFGPYIVALLVASFNVLPTLVLTKYTYYSPMLSDTLHMFPTLSQLLHSPWGYGVSLPGITDGMSFELGMAQWIALLAGLIVYLKYHNRELGYLLLCSLAVLFFILPISIPLYSVLHLTSIIDFPWRLLLCLVFAASWAGAHVLEMMPKTFKYLISLSVVLLLIIQSVPIAHTDLYWDKPLTWFARETGDSYGEYAPLTRETRDSSPFWKRAEFTMGNGEITTLVERSNHQKYLVTSEDGGKVRINTAYFTGWNIPHNCSITTRTLDHIDDSGLIGCNIEKGEQILEIVFTAPPVQRVGNLLTLAGTGVYIWILYRSFSPPLTKRKR